MDTVKTRFWRQVDWPSAADCLDRLEMEDLEDPVALPQAFLSPENKGFLYAAGSGSSSSSEWAICSPST